MPAVGLKHPDYWLSLSDEKKAQGYCGGDMCWTADGHYFVKGILILPIVDQPNLTLEYSAWSSLSEANYDRYQETYSDADQSKLGGMFGWFSNSIQGFPGSLNLKCEVRPQDGTKRPLLDLEPTEHPLSLAQHNGIAFDEAQRLVHMYWPS